MGYQGRSPWLVSCPRPSPLGCRLETACVTASLLEQIFEGLTRVVRLQRGWGGSLFLHHHSHRVQAALIALVLARDAFRDRLRALKSARRIKVGALLAGVQFKATLGTLADRITECMQKRSALRAPGNNACAR